MPDIVTLTMNPAVDLFVQVDRVVADEKLRCRKPRRDPGGGGINVARAIQRLGGSALAVFSAAGSTGDLLRRLLEDEGLEAKPTHADGLTRENFTAYEEGSDRQFRFVLPGPELGSEERDRLIDACLSPQPSYLVASGSLPPGAPADFYADLARRAQDAGVRFVLDTAGDALREGVSAGVFLLKPNLRELSQIAGRDVSEDPEQEEAARGLVDDGSAEVVVVSLGAAGVLLVWSDGAERIAAPTVPIRSRVGAGDSTVAGITLALSRGEDLPTAVRFGVAAGAAAVMTPGTELCRRSDTHRLFERLQGSRTPTA